MKCRLFTCPASPYPNILFGIFSLTKSLQHKKIASSTDKYFSDINGIFVVFLVRLFPNFVYYTTKS